MKKFIKTFTIFLTIILIPLLFELVFLPKDYFNYRVTESLMVYDYKNHFYGYFYPNQKIVKTEFGDSGHHTKYAIPKEVTWVTDSLGFRNTIFTRKPEIIFVGDSQTGGCALDQKDMLSELFRTKTNKSSYCIARDGALIKYRNVRRDEVIKKPKVVVYQTTERDLPMYSLYPEVASAKYASTILKYNLTKPFILFDRFMKGNMKNYLSARFSNVKGYGVNSPQKEDFLYAPILMRPLSTENIERSIDRIKEYKAFFEAEGVTFIVLPIPNKETIYYDYVPDFEEQPSNMQLLAERLDEEGVYNINLFELFNKNRTDETPLFHFDDAHWTARGVEITVDALIELIEEKGLLD